MASEVTPISAGSKLEQVLIAGNLASLSDQERVQYYNSVCQSVGLNPLTKPFEYITLNGKLTLYARKDCTDQLRSIHNVSLTIAAREVTEGIYVVTARATKPDNRTDESIGAVPIENLKGENKSNALMKAETKAKRRVTLSICGLGLLDETEIDSIPEIARGPVGSKEAAQEVAKQKLASFEKEKPAEAVAYSPIVDVDMEVMASWNRMKEDGDDLKEILSLSNRAISLFGPSGTQLVSTKIKSLVGIKTNKDMTNRKALDFVRGVIEAMYEGQKRDGTPYQRAQQVVEQVPLFVISPPAAAAAQAQKEVGYPD